MNKQTKQPMSTLTAQRRFLLSEEKASIDYPAEVKALCKQVVAVSTRTIVSPYNAINYRRQMFARWAHFGALCVIFTINPLDSRSPFCWNLCNADFNLQHYSNLGEAKHVMPNDFEMI